MTSDGLQRSLSELGEMRRSHWKNFVLRLGTGTRSAQRVMQVLSESGDLPPAHRAAADARALAEMVRAVLAVCAGVWGRQEQMTKSQRKPKGTDT
jgi:hypothetical protein